MRNLRSLAAAAFVVCTFSTAGAGHEYGTPADLKGLTIYFVDSGTDVATHNDVESKLRQETTQLRSASSREDAHISIDVTGNDRSDDGAAFVVYVTGKNGQPRLVQSFTYTHSNFPRLKPTSRFARDFAKLWLDAQSSK